MTERLDLFVVGASSGHGGTDPGTTAGEALGIIEADYCLEVTDDIEGMAPSDWMDVVRLNAYDETIKPPGRAQRARERGCHFVLSVHVNEEPGGTASHGLHAFFRPGCDAGKRIAETIARAAPVPLRRQHLYPVDRGGVHIAGGCEPGVPAYWPRVAAVLEAYEPIPTVLVELFYASHSPDCVAARDPAVQLGLRAALMAGLAEAGRLLAPRGCAL